MLMNPHLLNERINQRIAGGQHSRQQRATLATYISRYVTIPSPTEFFLGIFAVMEKVKIPPNPYTSHLVDASTPLLLTPSISGPPPPMAPPATAAASMQTLVAAPKQARIAAPMQSLVALTQTLVVAPVVQGPDPVQPPYSIPTQGLLLVLWLQCKWLNLLPRVLLPKEGVYFFVGAAVLTFL
jgi:hypothetical protein